MPYYLPRVHKHTSASALPQCASLFFPFFFLSHIQKNSPCADTSPASVLYTLARAPTPPLLSLSRVHFTNSSSPPLSPLSPPFLHSPHATPLSPDHHPPPPPPPPRFGSAWLLRRLLDGGRGGGGGRGQGAVGVGVGALLGFGGGVRAGAPPCGG